MLEKLVSIRNVGPFRDSAAAGNPELSRHVLILGANGSGKTTLGAVLRSVVSGDPSPITSRKTFGIEGAPSVELSFSGETVSFDGEAWSTVYPDIAVFDAAFVEENIHSDHVIEVEGERSLYRLIIGEEGVRLLSEDTRLTAESQRRDREITAAENAIWAHVPRGWDPAAFLALLPVPDVDGLIAEQERLLAEASRARQIGEHPPLSTLTLPTLPEAFGAVLAREPDDLERACESEVAEHLGKHGMAADGRSWLAKGLEHAGDGSCPFCDAYIEGLPLISAYRVVFGERDGVSGLDLDDLSAQLSESFGATAVSRLRALAERNRTAIDFWRRHCTFDPDALEAPDQLFDAILELGEAGEGVLDERLRTPSGAAEAEKALGGALAALEAAQGRARQIADATEVVNALIAAKKEEVEAAAISGDEAELERLRAIKLRHTEPLATLCTDYLRLLGEKREVDDRRAAVRARLNRHTSEVLEPYEGLINHYLSAFNASFRLTRQVGRGEREGRAASSYRLVPDTTAVERRNGQPVQDGPILEHTLSSGDRTTLALAFFLAVLSQDEALAKKTVVFDDPSSGQDAYRRRQSVHEITEVSRKCAQVIVLSHDATFLKQVWEKIPSDDRSALTLAAHGARGSKIVPLDLEGAYQGRTQTDLDDLHTFVTMGAGKPLDMIRKMRAVLEVHCRTTYPDSFEPGHDSLEEIVAWIRDTGARHPANDLYDELDQINDFTSRFHHGGASTYGTSKQVDRSETARYAQRTLKIVNALQA